MNKQIEIKKDTKPLAQRITNKQSTDRQVQAESVGLTCKENVNALLCQLDCCYLMAFKPTKAVTLSFYNLVQYKVQSAIQLCYYSDLKTNQRK